MDVKISVVLPVYNVANYLKKCLDSLVNQTFKDFELILVDDGSPDNSGQIADSISASVASTSQDGLKCKNNGETCTSEIIRTWGVKGCAIKTGKAGYSKCKGVTAW